jgi:hypothetical protein
MRQTEPATAIRFRWLSRSLPQKVIKRIYTPSRFQLAVILFLQSSPSNEPDQPENDLRAKGIATGGISLIHP